MYLHHIPLHFPSPNSSIYLGLLAFFQMCVVLCFIVIIFIYFTKYSHLSSVCIILLLCMILNKDVKTYFEIEIAYSTNHVGKTEFLPAVDD